MISNHKAGVVIAQWFARRFGFVRSNHESVGSLNALCIVFYVDHRKFSTYTQYCVFARRVRVSQSTRCSSSTTVIIRSIIEAHALSVQNVRWDCTTQIFQHFFHVIHVIHFILFESCKSSELHITGGLRFSSTGSIGSNDEGTCG